MTEELHQRLSPPERWKALSEASSIDSSADSEGVVIGKLLLRLPAPRERSVAELRTFLEQRVTPRRWSAAGVGAGWLALSAALAFAAGSLLTWHSLRHPVQPVSSAVANRPPVSNRETLAPTTTESAQSSVLRQHPVARSLSVNRKKTGGTRFLPRPEPLSPPPPAAPPTREADSLVLESDQLAEALELLQTQRDPQGALASLTLYHHRFPHGQLLGEATAAEVDAYLSLGQAQKALEILDRFDASAVKDVVRTGQLNVEHAELLSSAGRCPEALTLLDRTSTELRTTDFEGRALYTRAVCEAREGHPAKARGDFQRYLARFPQGRFAPQVRSLLEGK